MRGVIPGDALTTGAAYCTGVHERVLCQVSRCETHERASTDQLPSHPPRNTHLSDYLALNCNILLFRDPNIGGTKKNKKKIKIKK